jgi:dTMP kinase
MTSINEPATAAISSTGRAANEPRGAFIVLEGLDRSGKTTQVKLLEQRFVEAGKKVKVMRFPGTSCFGAHGASRAQQECLCV